MARQEVHASKKRNLTHVEKAGDDNFCCSHQITIEPKALETVSSQFLRPVSFFSPFFSFTLTDSPFCEISDLRLPHDICRINMMSRNGGLKKKIVEIGTF